MPAMTKGSGRIVDVSGDELERKLAKSGSGIEKRRDERVDVRWEVEVPVDTWKQARQVYTRNISRGGLLLSVQAPASFPFELELTLTLPDKQKIVLWGEVRHAAKRPGTEEVDVGVQLREMDPATLARIEAALQQGERKGK